MLHTLEGGAGAIGTVIGEQVGDVEAIVEARRACAEPQLAAHLRLFVPRVHACHVDSCALQMHEAAVSDDGDGGAPYILYRLLSSRLTHNCIGEVQDVLNG